ncbi:uncharacterized protein LACBIDRAFT_328311 [Laccaria bicolor S238N-H82]|uniref:Predicted protein n=1 Tax=Laccaria bicolor (strain S238N-H82 / ATCC MYA-4686) TaxID=486041 RepID=B0DEH8_LACBS|nr:uncharacterized protein LACBIDRAFT_328311 [Laccaria bicolor S238N-H82]EDR06937.1 predicted protein [Laccaria bicolor S238N-H82]|eukprot:XP_001882310.1 predicted protein [Laccaria bicolor S238N-H82]
MGTVINGGLVVVVVGDAYELDESIYMASNIYRHRHKSGSGHSPVSKANLTSSLMEFKAVGIATFLMAVGAVTVMWSVKSALGVNDAQEFGERIIYRPAATDEDYLDAYEVVPFEAEGWTWVEAEKRLMMRWVFVLASLCTLRRIIRAADELLWRKVILSYPELWSHMILLKVPQTYIVMGGALQSDSAFSPSKFVKQRRIPGNEASSADKFLGSLYGRFSWVTSAPNTRKPYAIYMSPLTALPVSPSLEVSGRLSLLILNVFSRTPTFAHSANESRFCSSLKLHPSLHRQLVYASQSPTACLPRATYTPRIHGFLSVFGASGEIQGGVDNGFEACPKLLNESPSFQKGPCMVVSWNFYVHSLSSERWGGPR